MGKKKPFIDKKTAMVYHVVRRSQRDVGTEATAETLSDFVLMPSPENAVRVTAAGSSSSSSSSSPSFGCAVASIGGGRKKDKVVNFRDLEARVAAAGLLDDTAKTYARYTRPIDRSGVYVPASSNVPAGHRSAGGDAPDVLGGLLTDASRNALDEALDEAMAVREVGRMLDSIALTADCMEEDVAAAMFGDFEDGDFEELDDDFCLTANREGGAGEDGEDDDDDDDDDGGGFNFERHVRSLMERARANENGGAGGGGGVDDDFFAGVAPLGRGRMDEDEEDGDDFDYDCYGESEEEEDEDEDEDDDDEDNSLDRELDGNDDERQRALCQRFEEALLEYDSDEVGDLDNECDDIVGDRPLEGDACLEAALDEYLTERDDEVLFEGRQPDGRRRAGGSGYSALVGRTMVNASDLDDAVAGAGPSMSLLINIEESKRQMQADLAEADATLANPEMDLPPEEVFIDGKSYFSVTSRNPWDCESILSTYSNLDNNPVIICRSGGRRRKNKKNKERGGDASSTTSNDDVIPEDGPAKIRLSNKTGLPLRPLEEGVVDDDDDYFGEGSTYLSVNRGERRQKDETKDEKRDRKMAVRDERKVCRMQKKMMKEAFAEEFQKRGHDVIVDPVGGNTVFRFS